MKKIGRLFLQGLAAILPAALTIYVLYWLALSAESLLGGLIKAVITERFYVPGMGIAAGFVAVLGVGILLRLWLVRKIFSWAEAILETIPLVKSLYGAVSDLMGFFDKSKKKDFDKVVMVSTVPQGPRLMGLVTREDFDDLPKGISSQDTVAVYMPMSYQMGGFTVMVPKTAVEPVDMPVEDALRFCLTAAISTQKRTLPDKTESPS